MVDGTKGHSLENVRLRITRMARMLDGTKAHSLGNRRLRITRMARIWVTRILVWGISVITPLPAGEGTGEGPAVVCWGASRLYAVLALLSLLFIIYTLWERLQQDRVDLRCCSLIIPFVCCSFTLLTIYSPCYHFIGLPFSSFLDSEATLTSKSAVVLLSSTNFFPSHFLIKAKPEEIG
mgnify:CR=1 FL=1